MDRLLCRSAHDQFLQELYMSSLTEKDVTFDILHYLLIATFCVWKEDIRDDLYSSFFIEYNLVGV